MSFDHDLTLEGARVIDAYSGTDEYASIGIKAGRISSVSERLNIHGH